MATIEERAKTHITRSFTDMNDFQAGYMIGAEEQEELLKSQLPKCNAISLINYLDKNRHEGKMCFSNMECADLEKAFKEGDWAKVIRYINKYLNETKDETKDVKSCSTCKFYNGHCTYGNAPECIHLSEWKPKRD